MNTSRSRVSPAVRKLGFDGSPLPLDEWLKLQQTIASGQVEGTYGRINLPPAILCCATCRKEVVRPAHAMRKAPSATFYCSRACWSEAQNTQRFGPRTCSVCGGAAPKATSYGRDAEPYCSTVCRDTMRERRKAATRESNTRPCEWCGTLFVRVNRYSRFCCRQCASLAHSDRMGQAGNPKWKDGATQRRQVHGSRAFRVMRPLVVAADGHQCVACGRANTRLEVHHLNSDPTDNRARNLVTLCSACHREWHRAEAAGRATPWPWLSTYTRSRRLSTTSK